MNDECTKGRDKRDDNHSRGVHGALRVLVTPAPCFALTRSDPPGRTGRRLDGGAGGGWQEQDFGVTASLTRSRGERPWEAMGTTSIARIGQESSTTTGTLIIIIIIAPLVFGPGGSLGSPVPRGERTLEGSLVDVERNGLQNTQAQYRTSLKPCGGSFGHAAYLHRYRRGSEVLWTRRRPPSLPSR